MHPIAKSLCSVAFCQPCFTPTYDDSDDDVITMTTGDEVVKDWYSEISRVSFRNIEAGHTLTLLIDVNLCTVCPVSVKRNLETEASAFITERTELLPWNRLLNCVRLFYEFYFGGGGYFNT